MDKIKNKYEKQTLTADKRKKEKKQSFGTPQAGTSKNTNKEELENSGPTNAVSTPMAGLDLNTPIDTLTTLVHEVFRDQTSIRWTWT